MLKYLNVNFIRANRCCLQWGATTRLIGACVMVHSDDTGLVLPPRVAPVQVVLVPILKPLTNTNKDKHEINTQINNKILNVLNTIKERCIQHNIRVDLDARDYITNGVKFYEWERKGVPIRIELGIKEHAIQCVTIAKRFNSQKSVVDVSHFSDINYSFVSDGDGQNGHIDSVQENDKREKMSSKNDIGNSFTGYIQQVLDDIHNDMYNKANQHLQSHIFPMSSYEELNDRISRHEEHYQLNKKSEDVNNCTSASSDGSMQNEIGLYLVPWKDDKANEATIKKELKLTLRCYPLEHNRVRPDDGVKCFFSKEQATHYALFGRAF